MSKSTKQSSVHVIEGIPVILVRGGVKNYNLRVRPDGSVRVSMPALGSIEKASQLVRDHKTWIEKRLSEQTCVDNQKSASPSDVQADIAKIREVLPELVEHYETEMGVHCNKWRLRHMVSRWGSCNIKTKAITLNSELAHMPQMCLESVIVHELCHLLEPSHNRRFHELMDQYYPSWPEARAYLNAHPPRR